MRPPSSQQASLSGVGLGDAVRVGLGVGLGLGDGDEEGVGVFVGILVGVGVSETECGARVWSVGGVVAQAENTTNRKIIKGSRVQWINLPPVMVSFSGHTLSNF